MYLGSTFGSYFGEGYPNNRKPLLDMVLSFHHGKVVYGECESVRRKREFQSESG
jgi:hypothetical protein